MLWREIIYQYDGSFDGFLCCVYESYTKKERPTAILSDGDDEPSLFEIRAVVTVPAHAQRVYRSFFKISPQVGPFLRRAFLTCMENKEMAMYRFIVRLYREGAPLLTHLSDETYLPLRKAVRHLSGEAEALRGFVRFSELGGILGAEIEPKNQVLPFLRRHFCDRYANETFFIYDRTHKELLMYAKGKSRIVPVDTLQLSLPGDEEIHYRTLWKRFYETIAIKERYNPRCQNTFLPKRYRGTMTEFLPADGRGESQTVIPSAAPAASQVPGVPDGKPAPATRPRSSLPAPESGI